MNHTKHCFICTVLWIALWLILVSSVAILGATVFKHVVDASSGYLASCAQIEHSNTVFCRGDT